jgi:hypothetical protein
MATLDDINAEKQAQLDIIDTELLAAAGWRNQGVAGMDAKVQALRDERTALELQDYEAAMDSAALAQALATLQGVTQSMKTTAAKLTSATAFITHVNDLIGDAKGAVSALKGG